MLKLSGQGSDGPAACGDGTTGGAGHVREKAVTLAANAPVSKTGDADATAPRVPAATRRSRERSPR